MYQATLISSKSQSKHTLETNLSDRYKSPFGAGTLPVGWKYGKELETMNKYSEELRITIQHCLMEDYELRISSSDLLEKALLFAARYDGLRGSQNDGVGVEGPGEWSVI